MITKLSCLFIVVLLSLDSYLLRFYVVILTISFVLMAKYSTFSSDSDSSGNSSRFLEWCCSCCYAAKEDTVDCIRLREIEEQIVPTDAYKCGDTETKRNEIDSNQQSKFVIPKLKIESSAVTDHKIDPSVYRIGEKNIVDNQENEGGKLEIIGEFLEVLETSFEGMETDVEIDENIFLENRLDGMTTDRFENEDLDDLEAEMIIRDVDEHFLRSDDLEEGQGDLGVDNFGFHFKGKAEMKGYSNEFGYDDSSPELRHVSDIHDKDIKGIETRMAKRSAMWADNFESDLEVKAEITDKSKEFAFDDLSPELRHNKDIKDIGTGIANRSTWVYNFGLDLEGNTEIKGDPKLRFDDFNPNLGDGNDIKYESSKDNKDNGDSNLDLGDGITLRDLVSNDFEPTSKVENQTNLDCTSTEGTKKIGFDFNDPVTATNTLAVNNFTFKSNKRDVDLLETANESPEGIDDSKDISVKSEAVDLVTAGVVKAKKRVNFVEESDRVVQTRVREIPAIRLTRDDVDERRVIGDEKSISEEAPSTPTSSIVNGEWAAPEEDIDRLVAIHQHRTSMSSLGPRSDSMASVYSGAGESRYGTVAVRGEVEFSLSYSQKSSSLEITIKQCRDLAAVDAKRNRSDPYVKVYLLPDKSKSGKRKTKVKKHTLNPVFDETLKFSVTLDGLKSRTLWLTVWHSDMFGRNDFLGEVMMSLENKVFDDTSPHFYHLNERTEPFDDLAIYKGDIIIGLKFVPPDVTVAKKGKRSRGALHVLVKEAKNLTAVKAVGSSDPFCKCYLLPDKGRASKQKTPVVRRNCSPTWNYTFVYDDVTLQELSERCLELTVWDHDRLASNEFLGGLRFSLGSGKHYGKVVDWMDANGKELQLWQSMLERPNFWVEGSIALRPSLELRTTSAP